MSILRPGLAQAENALSLHVSRERDYTRAERSRRGVSLMRKYEIAALLPDLTIAFRQHVAPATPVFEECASGFARGTLIRTVNGDVAIEDLLPGDYIETASGAVPVMWIGSTVFVPGHDDDCTTLTSLTRVSSEAFGPGRPAMDLLLGPAARMTVRHERLKTLIGHDTVLAPVADYVDGDRFFRITPAGTVQLYHLMTREHTTIDLGGLSVETYHPGKSAGQTLAQSSRALFLSMFPNIDQLEDFGQTRITRTTREVIDSLVTI
jgi:hypothetical protein